MTGENELQGLDKITSHRVKASSDNTMDLLDLWIMLVRWKVVVIGVAFVTFFVIVVNAYLNVPVPVYKSRAYLSLPLESDIEGVQGYIPQKAFDVFVQNLKSRAMRLRYFNENKLLDKLVSDRDMDAEQMFEEKFNSMLSVISLGDHANVSFEGGDARLVAEWVNGFVTLANEETVRMLIQAEISRRDSDNSAMGNQKSEMESNMNALRMSIANMRKNAKREREDQIIRLEEMALIAERIGIKDEILTSSVFLYQSEMPLFVRGAKALRAQAGVLRERKSDDPFNSEIRNAHSQLARMESQIAHIQSDSAKSKLTQSDLSHLSSMQVMQMATIPEWPINKQVFKWIILTAVLSSLVLGLLAAFFADFIVRAREKEARQLG